MEHCKQSDCSKDHFLYKNTFLSLFYIIEESHQSDIYKMVDLGKNTQGIKIMILLYKAVICLLCRGFSLTCDCNNSLYFKTV